MKYLLQMSVGPVQGFIAASRKTRDLKRGSDLLQGMARVCVEKAIHAGANLIFPAVPGATRSQQLHALRGVRPANVILCVLDVEPAPVAKSCRDAVLEYLLAQWTAVIKRSELAGVRLDTGLAERQIAAFPEFAAAWVPLGDSYSLCRAQVGRLLAARKSLRDFGPAPSANEPQPKSPLDPSFESVVGTVRGSWRVDANAQRQMLLKPREALDAISLIKRFSAMERFPSIRRIAVADLLAGAKGTAEWTSLQEFINKCPGDIDEGDVLFGSDEIPAENGDQARRLARDFLDKHNEGMSPRRYYAVLHGDGDSMGVYLDSLATMADHEGFSRRLGSRFADKVDQVVGEHLGVLVFAGGDDVVALLPASRGIETAGRIRELFREAMGADHPTLSIGLAICPVDDDLQACIRYAKSMEALAKREAGKDRLAVGVRTRSGGTLEVARPWTAGAVHEFQRLIEAYLEDRMPRGFPYEVAALATELDRIWDLHHGTAVQPEYERIRLRKEPVPPEGIVPAWLAERGGLARFAEMLKIAHFMTRRGEDT